MISAMNSARQVRAGFGARAQHTSETAFEPAQPSYSASYAMTSSPASTSMNSGGWVMFTYIQFAVAVFMAGVGLFFLDVPIQVKGYMLMSSVFLIGTTFTLAKTIRDEHEAKKFAARIDDARTEKLLMEVGRN